MGSISSGGGRTLLAVAVVAVLVVSVYSAFEISSLQGELSALQNEVSNDQAVLNSLRGSLYSLEASLATTSTSASATGLGIAEACVAVTQTCPGTYAKTPQNVQSVYVYWILIENQGSEPIPVNSSVFVGVKDASRLTFVGFNSTLPQAVAPNSAFVLNGTAWPKASGAGSRLSPGDLIELTVSIGNSSASLSGRVYSCSVSTVSFVNASSSQTTTLTSCG